MKNTFYGGVHPDNFKRLTKDKQIEVLTPPKQLVIPLSQHIGAPCEPLVAVGDKVKLGQKIGAASGGLFAPVHASVSGEVIKIESRIGTAGVPVASIIIENDFLDTPHESLSEKKTLDDLSPEEITAAIGEAGIVGMGGATFPTASKISLIGDDPLDYIIINGVECEPYLTPDYRLMIESPEKVILGTKLVLKAFKMKKGYIGIEDNKPDAIELITKLAAEEKEYEIHVVPLKEKYPQGGEKMLIFAVSGRVIPSGKLPSEVGAANLNLGTCVAVHDAVYNGNPLYQRVVSVTGGGIKEPKNLMVRIGTPIEYVIEHCGGLKDGTTKVLAGGPMMGTAVFDLSAPVTKGTSGLVCLQEEGNTKAIDPQCIRCGKCVDACPMHLVPTYLNACGLKLDMKGAEHWNIMDCIECGACAYVCPAKIPLVQTFRATKLRVMEERKKAM